MEHLSEQAKDLIAAFRRGEPEAAARLQRYFAGPPAALRLTHAQLVLAREYGFPSWARLRAYATSPSPAYTPPTDQTPGDPERDLPAKRCRICGAAKFLGHFSKTRRSADGHQSACKTCMSAARRSREGRGPRARPAVRALVRRGDATSVSAVAATSARDAAWALRQAAQYGQPAVLSRILESGVPNGPALTRALWDAAQRHTTIHQTPGHAICVRLLLEAGADVNARGGWTYATPLEMAAAAGAADSVAHMLRVGARTDVWHHAILGHSPDVERLVRAAPELASRSDVAGLAPLHRCAQSGLGRSSASTEAELVHVARFLLDRGASVDAPNLAISGSKRQRSVPPLLPPLHWAAVHGNLAVALLLLERGADPNAWGEWGSALGHAVLHCPGLPAALLARGAHLDAADPKTGATVLHGMANHPRPEAVRWLLAHGADVHARLHDGRTPLHRAAERNTGPQVVAMLMDAGADINARDAAGMTPLGYALERGKLRVAEYLRSRGAQT